MRASSVLVASSSPEKGTVLLTVTGAGKMNVIGASVPMTVLSGALGVHSFGVCPKKGTEGILAVSVWVTWGKSDGAWLDFMLPVEWKYEKPLVDLENAWIPSAIRRGQIVGQHIHFCIDNQWFTTNPCRKYSPDKDMRHLPDANLALSYLVGDVTKMEVLMWAEEAQKEASAQEQLKTAQDELKVLRDQKKTLEQVCQLLSK